MIIEYFVEKDQTGPYKYKIMSNVDGIMKCIYACRFEENAEKIAQILNDDSEDDRKLFLESVK